MSFVNVTWPRGSACPAASEGVQPIVATANPASRTAQAEWRLAFDVVFIAFLSQQTA
jgi:hypothetical protein